MDRNRVIIENVAPEVNGGRFYIKRAVGGGVVVSADIFADGYDTIRAFLHFRHETDSEWSQIELQAAANDRWSGRFITSKPGFYSYKIRAWVDCLATWYTHFKIKYAEGQPLDVELEMGARFMEALAKTSGVQKSELLDMAAALRGKEGVPTVISPEFEKFITAHPYERFTSEYDHGLRVWVGSRKGLFSSWYQLFPRSTAQAPGQHGSFRDVEQLLPRIAQLGFDVLYLPPIHPIGETKRKGRNNALIALPGDPGSPWAIGSKLGGHTAIHPDLGTLDDFEHLLRAARKTDIEIAFDLAFQCSPDHPWIQEHPTWFAWRPDGTIAYAENPPFRYEDVVPFHFECDDWKALWEALRQVTLFWVEKGVKIFRVAVPQTKPLEFWEWLIDEVRKVNPEVIFFSAALASPKIMASLAKVGFSQSYSYFIWRNTRQEVEDYLREITGPELRQYFRPSFWPNLPDVLPYHLMNADSNVFALRLLLAATLSSNYGVYGPVFENLENQGMPNGKEEYLHSEKYEVKHYDWSLQNRITDLMTKINAIRKENAALQSTFNLHFSRTDNDEFLSYIKISDDQSNIIWCIVNFDTQHTQSGYVEVPKQLLGIDRRVNLRVEDLLSGEVYYWFNDWNYVEINPQHAPMHVFRVQVVQAPHDVRF
jgi:starch synthase (maltosyl-transferring)